MYNGWRSQHSEAEVDKIIVVCKFEGTEHGFVLNALLSIYRSFTTFEHYGEPNHLLVFQQTVSYWSEKCEEEVIG